jgi:hypothetical protein
VLYGHPIWLKDDVWRSTIQAPRDLAQELEQLGSKPSPLLTGRFWDDLQKGLPENIKL